ncbi:MAG: hypothetical protein BWY59_02496 [Verrucomicrobia bacterium ADurb.Bin345]|nr:MAG: hypothetical protein BWY59_02496 [Verrucomicrobia bacterium ADurb.Bin345]
MQTFARTNQVVQDGTGRMSLPPSAVRCARLAPPPCSAGITDGSERGDYVPQSHLLKIIGRPHHVVNLMFQYYPDMDGWPTQGVNWHGFYRNNSLNKGDGYFPLVLEPGGRWGQAYLRQIADVRAHGQEPQLTLTLHANTPDETLARIADSLHPFAPMRIRINHECNGVWFHFNQVWSYKEVSDLFVRFHRILHERAPGVQTVACWNGPGDTIENPDTPNPNRGQLTDDQLGPMFRIADIVSYDQYAALHYGWPDPDFDPARPTQFFRIAPATWWRVFEDFHRTICTLRGGETPIEVHEVNEDAELAGAEGQAQWLTAFYREAAARRLPWLTNITFYQFRDRGGLGLEQEDPQDASRGRPTPALSAYADAIRQPHFDLSLTRGAQEPARVPADLLWRSPVDAAGIEYTYPLRNAAERVLFTCTPKAHLLVEHAGRWVIKPRGISQIPLARGPECSDFSIRVFAPPPDGRNNQSDAFVYTLDEPPEVLV